MTQTTTPASEKWSSEKLISCIEALLELDAKNKLVPHGIGGHARTLLEECLKHLSTSPQSAKDGERQADGLHVPIKDVLEAISGPTGRLKVTFGDHEAITKISDYCERLWNSALTPQSAKDGERQEALEHAMVALAWTDRKIAGLNGNPLTPALEKERRINETICAALTAKPDAPILKWREWWQGSGPERGYHIFEIDALGRNVREIAYYQHKGEGQYPEDQSRIITHMVMVHNDRVDEYLASGRLSSKAECPDGWKMVPSEPTWDMIMAGIKYRDEPDADQSCEPIYKSMLSAAPQPPIAKAE